MKRLLGVLWLGLSTLLWGQATHISGEISRDTRWFGRIILEGDVVVPRGVRLTIEPGTRIVARANSDETRSGVDPEKVELVVFGTLFAIGDAGDGAIIFTSDAPAPQPADWHGIILKNLRIPSLLYHCEIEYAYKGITCYGSSPEINACEIRYNHYAGISCEVRSKALIQSSRLSENNFAGLICELASTPVVESSEITQNVNGVIIFDRSNPDLGRSRPASGQSKGDNKLSGNLDIDIYNRSPNEIFAQNNRWDTRNRAEIHQKIMDRQDSPSEGPVIIDPLYRRPAPVAFRPTPAPVDTATLAADTADTAAPLSSANGLPDSLSAVISFAGDSAADSLTAGPALLEEADSALGPVGNPLDSAAEVLTSRQFLQGDSLPDSSSAVSWTVAGFDRTDTTDTVPPGKDFLPPPLQSVRSTPTSALSLSEDDGSEIVLEFQTDTGRRRYINRVKPQYPEIYRRSGFEGRVIMEVIVGYDGRVEDYKVLRSNGEYFTLAAEQAIEEMRYLPETFKNRPTKYKLYESFIFRLNP